MGTVMGQIDGLRGTLQMPCKIASTKTEITANKAAESKFSSSMCPIHFVKRMKNGVREA